jgi:mannose-6-phosphate isomerase
MKNLYPLKFKPFYQERIWGGERLKTALGKNFGNLRNCGESWELSAVQGHISVIRNGFLAGNNLQDVIEIYMGDLVGDAVYEKFGIEFPLLIKFIDAEQDLSIQVHPDDQLAKKRHNAYGKTEMWYVINADPGALINSGFNQPVDREKFISYLSEGKLLDLLCFEEIDAGDVFFIPAGRVHAIGKGVLVAEIQQTSDITYRIYDYDRKDTNGEERELHTELALDAIDFTHLEEYKTRYETKVNEVSEIVSCNYFTTNILDMDNSIERDYTMLDSFVIYICLEGKFVIEFDEGKELVKKGDTVLLPASIGNVNLVPKGQPVKLLEVYIK